MANGTLTAAMLKDMAEKISGMAMPISSLHASPGLFHNLPSRGARSQFFDEIPIYKSPVFPYNAACSTCDGTGEGTESTYCQRCKGAGEKRFEGAAKQGDQLILLTGKLPPKFKPSFPKGLVPVPPMCRGLA